MRTPANGQFGNIDTFAAKTLGQRTTGISEPAMTTQRYDRNRRLELQSLEQRRLLTAVPFGADSQDTGEFLLGDVSANVVFLESNGAIDDDTEQWNDELAEGVKANIEEGLQWWSDSLGQYTDVHELNFHVDYTFADDPVEISYEPISRGSQDFTLWIEEFYRSVDVAPSAGFTEEIRTFNHQQRLKHDTNWSFTIFVVNAENDPNDRFGDENANGTVFSRAFAISRWSVHRDASLSTSFHGGP